MNGLNWGRSCIFALDPGVCFWIMLLMLMNGLWISSLDLVIRMIVWL
jgi:hypothetical protein